METSGYGVALIAASAVGYALFDLLRKRLMEGTTATALLVVLAGGQVPVLLAWAAAESDWRLDAGYVLPGLGSAFLNVLANVAFLEALRVSALSVTIPVLSLTPVFTTWLAIPLLGQVPGPARWAGTALVVAGVLGLQVRGAELRAPRALVRRFLEERGGVLMVFVAVFWSLAAPLDRLALHHASTPVHAVVLNVTVAVGSLAWLATRGSLGELAGAVARPGTLLVALLVAAAAIGLQLLAIQEIWVGLAETLKRAIGSALALAFGWRLLKEHVSRWQVAAVAVMTVGVALVLL